MKKLLAFLLTAAMIFSLAACGADEPETPEVILPPPSDDTPLEEEGDPEIETPVSVSSVFQYIHGTGILISGYTGGATDIRIPEEIDDMTVTGIVGITYNLDGTVAGEGAFEGSHITTVYIPDNIVSIGEGAFRNCKDLISATYRGVTYYYDAEINDFPQELYDAVRGEDFTLAPLERVPLLTDPLYFEPLELMGYIITEDGDVFVRTDDWETCNHDLFVEHIFGTWIDYEAFTIDESYSIISLFIRGDVLIFTSGDGEWISWLDINNPDVMYTGPRVHEVTENGWDINVNVYNDYIAPPTMVYRQRIVD